MNAHVNDLLALYALDGLEPDELRQVEEHLVVCAACRADADREQALVAALAASLPAVTPDPRLRAATLAKVGVRAAKPSRPARAAAKAPASPRGWLSLPRWVPVALSLALAVLAGWNVYLTNELGALQKQVSWTTRAVGLITSPVTAEIALAPAEATAATAHGQAYVNQDSQDVVLVVQRLAPLETNQTYQAWIITADGPVSAGLFKVTANGWGMTWLNIPFRPGAAIGVSREPAGGSAQPTEVVLLGGL